MKAPYWFAVTRLRDNRLAGFAREVAELIDEETDPEVLRNLAVSLKVLADGAASKRLLIEPQNRGVRPK